MGTRMPSLCRSAAFNAVASSVVLGSLLSIVVMEDRIKQFLMPVQEADVHVAVARSCLGEWTRGCESGSKLRVAKQLRETSFRGSPIARAACSLVVLLVNSLREARCQALEGTWCLGDTVVTVSFIGYCAYLHSFALFLSAVGQARLSGSRSSGC